MSTNVTTSPRSRKQAAIDRATAKAYEQARADNLPTLLRSFTSADGLETYQVWSVGSRTVAGSVYTIDLMSDADGVRTLCDCPAADICWHRAAVRMAALGAIAYHDPATGRTVAPVTPTEAADLLAHFTPAPAEMAAD